MEPLTPQLWTQEQAMRAHEVADLLMDAAKKLVMLEHSYWLCLENALPIVDQALKKVGDFIEERK